MMIYALSPEHTEFGGRTIPESDSRPISDAETVRVDRSYTIQQLANEIKSIIEIYAEPKQASLI